MLALECRLSDFLVPERDLLLSRLLSPWCEVVDAVSPCLSLRDFLDDCEVVSDALDCDGPGVRLAAPGPGLVGGTLVLAPLPRPLPLCGAPD